MLFQTSSSPISGPVSGAVSEPLSSLGKPIRRDALGTGDFTSGVGTWQGPQTTRSLPSKAVSRSTVSSVRSPTASGVRPFESPSVH